MGEYAHSTVMGEIELPSRAWPLWVLTGLVVIGFPAVNFIYWPEVLRSGVLPPHGDSIAIPMFGSVLATLVLSPLILGVTWVSLRRYNPATRLGSWRRDRPYFSALATLLFGGVAALIVAVILDLLDPGQPWYAYLWPAYFALWLPWLLGLRAAAIDQLDYQPSYTER